MPISRDGTGDGEAPSPCPPVTNSRYRSEASTTMSGKSDPADPTVLVVEDDRDLAETYSMWLEPEYDVRTTYSGTDALTWYDSSVSVVVLDRRMPDLPGSTVIQKMNERDAEDQKAMLTSLEPGCDLVDIPCDEYLTKPVTKSELRETVHELRLRSELDDELQRYYRVTSKIVAIEKSDASGTEAAVSDLREEADRIRGQIQESIDELDGFVPAFRTID